MIILDTNVISELLRSEPTVSVANWARTTAIEELYLCAPVVAELAFGSHRFLLRTKSSRHLDNLKAQLSGPYLNRVLAFDDEHAELSGKMRALREASGRPVLPMDMAIAAIAKLNNATLATRNTRDFEGLDLKLINPFEA